MKACISLSVRGPWRRARSAATSHVRRRLYPNQDKIATLSRQSINVNSQSRFGLWHHKDVSVTDSWVDAPRNLCCDAAKAQGSKKLSAEIWSGCMGPHWVFMSWSPDVDVASSIEIPTRSMRDVTDYHGSCSSRLHLNWSYHNQHYHKRHYHKRHYHTQVPAKAYTRIG